MTHIDFTKLAGKTAKAQFDYLNSLDSKPNDTNIDACIWNQYAKHVGANKIQNFIKMEDAINTLTKYSADLDALEALPKAKFEPHTLKKEENAKHKEEKEMSMKELAKSTTTTGSFDVKGNPEAEAAVMNAKEVNGQEEKFVTDIIKNEDGSTTVVETKWVPGEGLVETTKHYSK